MIEVTEDAFVTKTHFQDEILPIFRKLGVRISIDDFGIGYSSLSALADITADEIKIDRSFITDIHKRPRSQGILRAIESLSEALGMTVIAEGLETLRGTGLSAGRDQDPLRPGLLLLAGRFSWKTSSWRPRAPARRAPAWPAGRHRKTAPPIRAPAAIAAEGWAACRGRALHLRRQNGRSSRIPLLAAIAPEGHAIKP